MQATEKRRLIDRDSIQRYGAIAMFVALFVCNCFFTKGFFQLRIFWNLIIQATPAIMVGLGMTLVIATGNINIAVGSMMGLGAVGFALYVKAGGSPALGLMYTMALGAFVGMIFGILVSKFRVQSMIVTMSGMYILRGLARALSEGSQVSYNNVSVSAISYYKVGGVIPVHVLLVFGLMLLMYLGVSRMRYGVFLEASGDNEHAARLAGINTVLIITLAYMVSTMLGAVSGIAKAIMVSSADGAGLGLNYEFDAIAATVVGGTPMAGGRPNLLGTLFAALMLQTIEIMVNMNGIFFAIAQIIKALIIVAAVYSQYAGKKVK